MSSLPRCASEVVLAELCANFVKKQLGHAQVLLP